MSLVLGSFKGGLSRARRKLKPEAYEGIDLEKQGHISGLLCIPVHWQTTHHPFLESFDSDNYNKFLIEA
jgi:hypothetical protein